MGPRWRFTIYLLGLNFGAPIAGAADIADVLARFHDAEAEGVLVAGHRGGYLSENGTAFPENSLVAMEHSIALGVEILEVDIQRTSDGHLVIMHDTTVNRTTNGTGSVSSMTLAQIKALRLKDPSNQITSERVPTLEETMTLVKGRAMVNLDKLDVTNTTWMTATMAVLRATGTVDHAIFKGSASASAVRTALARYEEELIFMPVLSDASAASTIVMLQDLKPPAMEMIFNSASPPMLDPEVIAVAKQTKTRIWINSLWSSLNGGHDDSVAISGNPDASWGWITLRGATIIQGDHLDQLIPYLESIGRRPGIVPMPIVYDFHDGTLQGWRNVKTSTTNATKFIPDTGDYGGRTLPVLGRFSIIHTPFPDGRDTYHKTLLLRSPEFHLHGLVAGQGISFSLLGGVGGAALAPASETALLPATAPGGFLGMALRRSRDGAYLLSARRTATGQGRSWYRSGWSADEILSVIGNDSATETYTLDLIDAYGPSQTTATLGWGWIAMDAVSIPWTGNGDPRAPQVHPFTPAEGLLEWSSYPGYVYEVERSETLLPQSWQKISNPMPAVFPTMNFVLPMPQSSREFFRIRRKDVAY